MGDEQEDYYAPRRAALEQQFLALPTPASAGYWQRIELAPKETALPLEVLCRCLRERWSAGATPDVNRIFTNILLRIQSQVHHWASKIASQGPGGKELGLADDLEQECFTAIWTELEREEPSMLVVDFFSKLIYIQYHVAHAVMEKEALWKRPSVTRPTRVQRGNLESIDANARDEEESSLVETLSDLQVQQTFDQVNSVIDLYHQLAKLDPTLRSIVYAYYWLDLTQQEIADRLGVTDRTVRNLLDKIKRLLRTYLGDEEEHRG